jgi:hypothetical protein
MVKMRTFRLSEWLAPETEVSNGFGLGFLHTSKSKAYWAITSDVHRTKHMTKAGERQAPHDPNSVHYDLAKWLQVTE